MHDKRSIILLKKSMDEPPSKNQITKHLITVSDPEDSNAQAGYTSILLGSKHQTWELQRNDMEINNQNVSMQGRNHQLSLANHIHESGIDIIH